MGTGRRTGRGPSCPHLLELPVKGAAALGWREPCDDVRSAGLKGGRIVGAEVPAVPQHGNRSGMEGARRRGVICLVRCVRQLQQGGQEGVPQALQRLTTLLQALPHR